MTMTDDRVPTLTEAACVNAVDRDAFTEHLAWRKPDQALRIVNALNVCARCPSARTACEAAQQPRRRYFTGIIGGFVWHEGQIVNPPPDRGLPGAIRRLQLNATYQRIRAIIEGRQHP